MQNEKKLVVLFPGFGYGPDKPLLYYAAKVARRQGLDCMVVQYSQLFPHEETPQASAAKSYPGAAQDAMTQIPAGYDRYICIAKSFGTMVAAGWVKAHPEYHVTLLQLTPPDVKSWTTFFTNKFEKGAKKNKPHRAFNRF